MLKKIWTQMYDKVKVVAIGFGMAAVLGLADTFINFDWTSKIGGPYATLIGLFLVGIGSYIKKEITGHVVNQVNMIDETFDPTLPPPVG